MAITIRLCSLTAFVGFALYAVTVALATPVTSLANCQVGYCFTDTDLYLLLFAGLGGVCSTLTGVLVLVAAIRARQVALGVGLALLIFINFAAALVYVATNAFQAILFDAPGAYFASNATLPWYFEAASVTFTILLVLAPLPALLFTFNHAGQKPILSPSLPLVCVLIAGGSVLVLDRVAEYYAAMGVGPAWPLLGGFFGFFVFWLIAWVLVVSMFVAMFVRRQSNRR